MTEEDRAVAMFGLIMFLLKPFFVLIAYLMYLVLRNFV